MAKQNDPVEQGRNINPSRYSEARAPQFVGGEVDAETGNIRPATESDAARGRTASTKAQTGDQLFPLVKSSAGKAESPPASPAETALAAEPRRPSTQLGSIEATSAPALEVRPAFTPPPPAPSPPNLTAQIAAAVAGAGAGILGKGGGGPSLFGSGSSGGGQPTSGGSGPLLPPSPPSFPGSSPFDEVGFDMAFNPTTPFVPPPVAYTPPAYDFYDLPSAPAIDPWYYSPPVASLPPDPGPTFNTGFSFAPDFSPQQFAQDVIDPFGSQSGGNFFSSRAGDSFTVICSELRRQNLLDDATWRDDKRFGAMVRVYHPEVFEGYMIWAPTAVKWMRRSKRFTRFMRWLAVPWAQVMAAHVGRNVMPPMRGVIIFHAGWHLCRALGALKRRRSRAVRATA